MRTPTSLSRLSDNCEAYYPFRGSASSFCITFDSVLFKQMNFSECDNKISSLKTSNIGCFLKGSKVSSRYFLAVLGTCKAVHVSVTWYFPLFLLMRNCNSTFQSFITFSGNVWQLVFNSTCEGALWVSACQGFCLRFVAPIQPSGVFALLSSRSSFVFSQFIPTLITC